MRTYTPPKAPGLEAWSRLECPLAVGLLAVAYIGLVCAHPLPCEIASQYICFCWLNSGVFHNTLHL